MSRKTYGIFKTIVLTLTALGIIAMTALGIIVIAMWVMIG